MANNQFRPQGASDLGRLLITGGAGYIGSWVTRELLSAGFRVTVFDNLMYGGASLLGVLGHPRFKFIKGDVRDLGAVDAAIRNIDYVVHLAAIVGEAACDRAPEEAREVNFQGAQNVARAARLHQVQRVIFFSTCSSYGVQDTTQIATEETELNPVSLYAKTKIDAEKFLLDTATPDTICTIFRPATVHGCSPRMRFDLIVNHFVRDAYTMGKLDIYGPEMWRPLMWVGEPAQAVALALNADERLVRNEVFNMGSTEGNYRKREIGEIIKSNFLPDVELNYVDTDTDPRSYRVDFSKIHDRLGFNSSKSLEGAIADLYHLLDASLVPDPYGPEYSNA